MQHLECILADEPVVVVGGQTVFVAVHPEVTVHFDLGELDVAVFQAGEQGGLGVVGKVHATVVVILALDEDRNRLEDVEGIEDSVVMLGPLDLPNDHVADLGIRPLRHGKARHPTRFVPATHGSPQLKNGRPFDLPPFVYQIEDQ